MTDHDDSGALVVRAGEGLLLSEPLRPYEDDPTLDFLVTAHGRWGSAVRPTRHTGPAADAPSPA
ncbi:hypothetical protein [Streptomyces sp. HNS054]|uniref:hypothetical protein n=1 Tax=Streptomyces TaxID=1883 RepID=UPI00065405B0|nr:hypothetical protein [Streptomyces sp. HNS054]WPW17442.1 hypothetical protein UBV09_01435 [Streptomyces griseoincarnatus]